MDMGRGRMLPSSPFEAIWKPIADWYGVEDAQINRVLPNLFNFPESNIFRTYDMFKSFSNQ
jgi:hypothetical protein